MNKVNILYTRTILLQLSTFFCFLFFKNIHTPTAISMLIASVLIFPITLFFEEFLLKYGNFNEV